MNDKEVLTEAEELRRQSSLLSTFEEIAQTFLSSVNGERENGKVFTFLQGYLDGSVLINGAYCNRRTVLLTIHDMNDEREAPPELQGKTLSKLELLNVRPLPQVTCYGDIATAILRMEVVIRLEAMQDLVESKLGAPPAQQIVNRNSWIAADHSQTEAAVFRAWREALAGDDQTAQQLEKSPISSPAAAKITFISRAPTWAPLVFVTILVVLFAQINNKVRSSAPTALDHSQTKAGCEKWGGMPCEMHSGSWSTADHSRAEAAEFRGQLEALAAEDQTVQQLEKSPIYRPSLLMQSAEKTNDSGSGKEPLPERTFQSELNALDHKLANQSAVPPFATNVEESVSGAREAYTSLTDATKSQMVNRW